MEQNGDILYKQIKGVAQVIAKILFKRDSFDYVLPENGNYSETDNLFIQLNKMLDENKINAAEDKLFSVINPQSMAHMQIALNFYQKLASKTKAELEENNFSLEEVEQGFFDVLKLYNIKIERK